MTFLHLFQDHSFDAVATKVMGQAFDHACAALGDFGRMAIIQEDLAKQIVEAAKSGERDPYRLHKQALNGLYAPRHPNQLAAKAQVSPRQPPLLSHARNRDQQRAANRGLAGLFPRR